MSLSTTNTKQKQRLIFKKIYIPRPVSSDDEGCEVEPEPQPGHDTPAWHRHFEPEELLGRCEPLHELGRGSYGVVYEGKVLKKCGKLEPGMTVAIKKVRRIFQTETDAQRLLRELRILRILRRHDSIVTLHDIIPPKEPIRFTALTIVLEFAGTELGRIFRTNQFFTTLHVEYMLCQMLQGLKHMHSAQIVHRDLKPANVLINEECSIKIRDFGLARGFDEMEAQLLQQWTFTASHQQALKSAISAFKVLHIPSEITSIISVYLISIATDKHDGSDHEQEEEMTPHSKKRRALLKLKKKKFKKRIPRRRVQPRWYEAPEMILKQQRASTLEAADMWSVAAIFAELLQMQRENRPDPCKRSPVFPGYACFSPMKGWDSGGRVDQMEVIFNLIGSPSESEIAALTDETARNYIRNLPQRKKKKLKEVFPGADEDALDLLSKLMMFAAEKRITADQALQHPYLKAVRDFAHRRLPKPVILRFDHVSVEREHTKLRELILEEVIKYNKHDEERLMRSGAMPNYKKMN